MHPTQIRVEVARVPLLSLGVGASFRHQGTKGQLGRLPPPFYQEVIENATLGAMVALFFHANPSISGAFVQSDLIRS